MYWLGWDQYNFAQPSGEVYSSQDVNSNGVIQTKTSYDKRKIITGNRSKELQLRGEDKVRLKKLLKFLKGSKADITEGQLAKVEKTEVITSAQELIDIVDNGWSTVEEFIHIYSLLCNAELVGEEREKFILSGRGDEIYASPLIGTVVEYKAVDKKHLSSAKKLKPIG